MADRYLIESREVTWIDRRYRIVRIADDGKRYGKGLFWTLHGAQRWIRARTWTLVPGQRHGGDE